jgi:lipoprotein-releasing system permease protein
MHTIRMDTDMFRPASFFIGLRYTRAKRRNHFISFISLMSILGIALGVIVLITVLSVFNGFDREIKKRAFSMVPPITLSSMTNSISNWRSIEEKVAAEKNVTGVAPYVSAQVLLTNAGIVQPATVSGIDPSQEKTVSELAVKMIQGSLDSLSTDDYGIVLGEELAGKLAVKMGDDVNLVTPRASTSVSGVTASYQRFTVKGIFRAGGGFGFDRMYVFINLANAQQLAGMGDAITGLHINIKNIYAANTVTEQLTNDITKELSSPLRIFNWTDQFGAFFHMISMQKTMMFFILLLIIAVAIFNLVSTLMMVVNEKEPDIAILRTIGATPRNIMAIFIVQGAMIGVVGTILGVVGGIALALNVTDLVNWIQDLFHVKFLSESVYFVDYLPSEIQSSDVWQIGLSALCLSLLATIYPAWRASRTEPVEALRYE